MGRGVGFIEAWAEGVAAEAFGWVAGSGWLTWPLLAVGLEMRSTT